MYSSKSTSCSMLVYSPNICTRHHMVT
jgi:hypothetical protein